MPRIKLSETATLEQISQASGNSLGKTISQHCILIDTKKFESAKEGNGTLTSHPYRPGRNHGKGAEFGRKNVLRSALGVRAGPGNS